MLDSQAYIDSSTYTEAAMRGDSNSRIIVIAVVLLVIVGCRCLDAYTEDFSVTRYRVPGVSKVIVIK